MDDQKNTVGLDGNIVDVESPSKPRDTVSDAIILAVFAGPWIIAAIAVVIVKVSM